MKNVIISNYNRCKLLTFFPKIEEPLSMRMSACSEASNNNNNNNKEP